MSNKGPDNHCTHQRPHRSRFEYPEVTWP